MAAPAPLLSPPPPLFLTTLWCSSIFHLSTFSIGSTAAMDRSRAAAPPLCSATEAAAAAAASEVETAAAAPPTSQSLKLSPPSLDPTLSRRSIRSLSVVSSGRF